MFYYDLPALISILTFRKEETKENEINQWLEGEKKRH